MSKSITIWAFGPFAEIAKRGGQQYLEEGNSDISVINVPDFVSYNEMLQALEIAIQQGSDYLPNIALMDVYQLRNFMEKYPDNFVSVNSILNGEDFIASAVYQVSIDGEIYAIPCAMEPVGLYYKLKMFEEQFGNEIENLTWEEVFVISYWLRENDKYFMLYNDKLPEILLQSGGHYFYDDSLELNSEGALEVFNFLEELKNHDVFFPQQYNEEGMNLDNLRSDDVFSVIGPPWLIPYINGVAEETGIEWRITDIPKNDNFKYDVCLGGYAWVVFPMDTLEERDEVEKFVKEVFISNTDLDLILAENNLVPAKKAAIERLYELEGNPYFGGQNVIASFAQFTNSVGFPLTHYNAYTQAAAKALNDIGKRVVKGKIFSDEAMAEFERELERIKEGDFGGGGVPDTVYVNRIEVIQKPYKTSYSLGEKFNPNGMKVKAFYSNGDSKTITDYTYFPKGKLYFNDHITIEYLGVQTILPITITANVKESKKYLYFSDRKFFNVEIGNNVCKIDAQFGLPNIGRGLISLGGAKLPLSLSLVYDSQFRQDSTIYNRETGLPNGIRMNYHQTCIEQEGEFLYTDSDINLHIFKPTAAINDIWADSQGTGLLLERVGNEIKIYDEFGNFSMFDRYGRLYLIHQKITEENSADLSIEYESETEKIKSVTDGMGRIATFEYLQNNVEIKVDGNAKIAIKSLESKLSSVIRYSNDDGEQGNEADEYQFNESGYLNNIKAANGEELSLTYNDDNAIIQYYINAQQKTCFINYDSKNQKTVITDNKGIEQVISFNTEDLCIGSYQDLDGKPVNIQCVDQESCAAFSSTLVTINDKFYFNESLQLSNSQTVTSNECQLEFAGKKFSVFSAMVNASQNAEATGSMTADLLDLDNHEVLCTLEFNPATEGLQIAAKPFMPLKDGGNNYKVRIKTNCSNGIFAFSDVVISPLFGSTEKFCSNFDIGEGSYSYTNDTNDRVYILNGGTGVSFDDGTKDENIVLYAEDYLANARNVYKNCRDDGSFVFWYNKKCNCKTRVKKATVYFGETGPTLTFSANGVRVGNTKVSFYSLAAETNGIIKITDQNYDSSSFAAGYENYYLESDTIISDGAKAVKNTAYYDQNFNLHVEMKRKNLTEIVQHTEYTVDSAGNTTAVSQKDESDPSKCINEFYGYDANDYLISASAFIQGMNSTSKYSYDTLGNVIASTAPNNFKQNLIYDSFGDRLIQLNADIGNQESVNNIDYAKAQVSKMSEEGSGAAYTFEYEPDNGNLKSVKINGDYYVEIARDFNFNGNGNDRVEIVYANAYQQTDIYDKYGHLIYKTNSYNSPAETLATYIYADDQCWDVDSPNEDGLEVSAAAKLYKVIDKCSNTTFHYNYDKYNQLSLIVWYGRHDDRVCNLFYTPNLLVEREEYYNCPELLTIKYVYRSDLNYFSDVEKTVFTVGELDFSAEKSWDNLNRVTGFKYLNHDNRGLQIDIGYLPREVNGTGTTNFIGEWRYRQFAGQPSTDRRVDTFEYDVNGNVTFYKIKIGNNSYDVRYEYDSANRLVRENNEHLNKTYTYAYDSNSNITAKKEYAYTTAALDAPAQNNYYDADRLTSWDGESFAYDKGGNPTLYKGEQMTWMRGRLLKSYTKGGKKYEFNYDASGERFVKKIGTQSTYYETINGKLLFEERADGTNITFLYGSDGIIGFAVGGKIYFYAKNVFGDVVALYDYISGDPVARYAYDAWGNHKVLTPEGNENSSPDFIGNINPIRYRSYYWDDDVKLYYLHTRWYDPEIGRFVNMDQLEYLNPETVNGLNLYAYCGNNPVKYVDLSGSIPFANYFFKSFAETLVFGFNNKWLGRIDYSNTIISEQTADAGFLYVYSGSDFLNKKNVYGAGINFWDWFGIDVSFDTDINLNVGINITPWFHLNESIGASGIRVGGGVTIDGKSHDFSVGIGLAPIALVATAVIAIFDGGTAFSNVLSWLFGV